MQEVTSGCTAANKQRAIDPQLFDWPSQAPALLASRCRVCQAMAFPARDNCMACGSTEVDMERLPTRGKLWTWTVQHFMPKSPYHSSETTETFRAYGIGFIEFPGALKVESRLTENDPGSLRIGAEMELVFYVHRTDDDGTEVINYAFKPVSNPSKEASQS